MPSFTNKGKYKLLEWAFRAATRPTNYFTALILASSVPTVDTNTLADLSEIAAGNGYTSGGYSLTPNATDFDVITEDDTNDLAKIQIKDVIWAASGGSIPASGLGARYVVLTDDNVTVSARIVICWWDLGSDRSASSGQNITLQDLEMRGVEP